MIIQFPIGTTILTLVTGFYAVCIFREMVRHFEWPMLIAFLFLLMAVLGVLEIVTDNIVAAKLQELQALGVRAS